MSLSVPANRNFGPFNSYAQHKEKINFALNGKNMFVGDGLDTPAKKLMLLNIHLEKKILPNYPQ